MARIRKPSSGHCYKGEMHVSRFGHGGASLGVSDVATRYPGFTAQGCKSAHKGVVGGVEATYVAFTSSFAGTGGIEEAMLGCNVACSGALFGGDFLRVRSFLMVGAAVSQTSVRDGGWLRRRGSSRLLAQCK